MSAIKYTLRPLKMEPNKSSLQLNFSYNGHRLRHNTKLNVVTKSWIESKRGERVNRVNKNAAGSDLVNNQLEVLERKILSYYHDQINGGVIPTPDELKRQLKPQPDNSGEVIEFIEGLINKGGAVRDYINLKIQLLEFTKARGGAASWHRLSNDMINEFIRFLATEVETNYRGRKKKGLLNSTINRHALCLKRVVRLATKQGHTINVDPLDIKKLKTSSHREVVTNHELNRLAAFDFTKAIGAQTKRTSDAASKANALQIAVDAYVFCFDTGLRHSDLMRLTQSNLINLKIEANTVQAVRYSSKKTSRQMTTLLSARCVRLIDKYKRDSAQLLPVKSLDKTNQSITEAFRLAGFDDKVILHRHILSDTIQEIYEKWELLTIHTARHSGITHLIKNNIPLSKVSEWAGHEDIQTTQIYEHLAFEDYATDILQVINEK